MSRAPPCLHSRRLCSSWIRHWPTRLVNATDRIVLGVSLPVSPWVACLRLDTDQCLSALVMVVQNKRDHLADSVVDRQTNNVICIMCIISISSDKKKTKMFLSLSGGGLMKRTTMCVSATSLTLVVNCATVLPRSAICLQQVQQIQERGSWAYTLQINFVCDAAKALTRESW